MIETNSPLSTARETSLRTYDLPEPDGYHFEQLRISNKVVVNESEFLTPSGCEIVMWKILDFSSCDYS